MERHPSQSTASTSTSSTTATAPGSTALRTTNPSPFLSASPVSDGYPISTTPSVTAQGAVQWQPAQQGRPSLTGGIPSGRVSGELSKDSALGICTIAIAQWMRAHFPSLASV